MEKKIEVLERNNRENEIELRNAFKRAFNFDPFSTTNTDISKIKDSYDKEINNLKAVIADKNNQITNFKNQTELIVRELHKLKKIKAQYWECQKICVRVLIRNIWNK